MPTNVNMRISPIKIFFYSLVFGGICLHLLSPKALWAQTNGGLGLVPVRNQFPISLRFLNMTPDTPMTLRVDQFRLSYQIAIANTFINTRGSAGDIKPFEVKEGLEKEDYFVAAFGLPSNGYNLYIDVESYRQVLRASQGITNNLEIGIQWPVLSFGGGWMDRPIEAVHTATDVDNYSEDGGFRAKSDRNRFDYYLIRGNRFIFKENKPFDMVYGDPVFDLKWNITRGTEIWPALAFKLAYKYAWDGATHFPRQLISSGRKDYGMYLLTSKSLFDGKWIFYFQGGQTRLDVKGKDFLSHLNHLLWGLEYQETTKRSWLFQWVHQSSIFPSRSPKLNGIREIMIDRGLGMPTDVLTVGGSQIIGPWLYSAGFAQDLNQTRNETDFVIFIHIEWGRLG